MCDWLKVRSLFGKREANYMQTQPAITGHLSPELAQIFLEGLPENIPIT
jgi:hypothetical protein